MVQRVLRSGLTRIKRHMADQNQVENARGRKDLKRVLERFPEFEGYEMMADELEGAFRVFQQDYNQRIGHPVHAASAELVTLLQVITSRWEPTKVVDLGSGFTSFVLRTIASRKEGSMEVWSVDDSPEWKEKTRLYLEEMKCPTTNLFTWDEFIAKEVGDFDLVLHDMGTMEFREETLRRALDLARPGGWVILDDVHKPAYRKFAMSVLEEMGLEWFSLREWTRDELTRYVWLVVR